MWQVTGDTWNMTHDHFKEKILMLLLAHVERFIVSRMWDFFSSGWLLDCLSGRVNWLRFYALLSVCRRKKTHFPVVNECIAYIGIHLDVSRFLLFKWFFAFWIFFLWVLGSLQTGLLCIIGELAGGGSVDMAKERIQTECYKLLPISWHKLAVSSLMFHPTLRQIWKLYTMVRLYSQS